MADRTLIVVLLVIAVLFRPSGALLGTAAFTVASAATWFALASAALWFGCAESVRRQWRWRRQLHVAVAVLTAVGAFVVVALLNRSAQP
jgi:4-amino-4-deoxy-L-arabinose transferase-like glycosyltransferase